MSRFQLQSTTARSVFCRGSAVRLLPVSSLSAQPGDQRLQRVTGIAGRVVGPDLVGQRARRHDTPGVQGEQSEQNPQLAAAYVDRAARLVPQQERA